MNTPLNIGISSYTYTWAIEVPGYPVKKPMTVYKLIERAAELKASVVQYADNLPLDKLSYDEQAALLSFAQEKNINIEVGSRGLTTAKLKQYIEIAENMHSEILRFVIDEPGYQPAINEVIAVIQPFIPSLEEKNIRLVLENHDRLKCSEFIHIIKTCNSPYVGICLDTVNSLGALEGTDEVIRQLLPYTLNLHIKDFTIDRLDHKMGFKVEGRPAGKGKLAIENLFSELSAKGNCKSAILELWTPFDATIEDTIILEDKWAIESMNYLNSLTY
ncbi:MAG: TIM barrel protein [Bacteroidales bacterium]|nr:TIM barrel protein [Bacteroidales bacterium]